jgi:hypothetical protein
LGVFVFSSVARLSLVAPPGQFCAAKDLQTLGAITRFLAC